MPYFVYALHTDSGINRQYGVFDSFKEAEACERDMEFGRVPGDNYVVRMFFAEDGQRAASRLEEIRSENGWPASHGA